jgi:hypothetical protein
MSWPRWQSAGTPAGGAMDAILAEVRARLGQGADPEIVRDAVADTLEG